MIVGGNGDEPKAKMANELVKKWKLGEICTPWKNFEDVGLCFDRRNCFFSGLLYKRAHADICLSSMVLNSFPYPDVGFARPKIFYSFSIGHHMGRTGMSG